MQKISLRQKILLSLFGLFVGCVFLELALRTGGFIYKYRQEQQNVVNFAEDEFRILCLGESTTAMGGENAYPAQLEEILNARLSKPVTVKVINKGLVSKSSKDLLRELPGNLQKYKPQVVVTMLGVNDGAFLNEENTWQLNFLNYFRGFRVVKLFTLLSEHLRATLSQRKGHVPARTSLQKKADLEENLVAYEEWEDSERAGQKFDDPAEVARVLSPYDFKIKLTEERLKRVYKPQQRDRVVAYIESLKLQQSYLMLFIGVYHKRRSDFSQAEKFFKMAAERKPDSFAAYAELGTLYREEGRCDIAEPLLKKAVELNSEGAVSLFELAKCYQVMGRKKEAFEAAEEIFKRRPDRSPWVYLELGAWLYQNDYLQEAEKFYLEVIRQNPDEPDAFSGLADLYRKLGRVEEAKKMKEKSDKALEKTQNILPVTVRNYNAIVDIIHSQGARIVVMQYPLRKIEPLKDIFWSDYPFVFVENKKNFEQGIEKHGFDFYFSDYFAGDFGHCTRAGNKLIAENLAEAILKNYF